MARGFVYILLNPSFHDQVKIGRTTDASETRARLLSSTSALPTPFIVIYDELVSDCEEVERQLHERFTGYRTSSGREFFRVPVKEAITALQELARRFQLESSIVQERREILPRFKERFASFLKPDIVSAAIVQYPDVCYFEITRRTNLYRRDEVVERIDLEVLGSDSFPPTKSIEDNASMFAEIDAYTLIMITSLMTDEGAQEIERRFGVDPARLLTGKLTDLG